MSRAVVGHVSNDLLHPQPPVGNFVELLFLIGVSGYGPPPAAIGAASPCPVRKIPGSQNWSSATAKKALPFCDSGSIWHHAIFLPSGSSPSPFRSLSALRNLKPIGAYLNSNFFKISKPCGRS